MKNKICNYGDWVLVKDLWGKERFVDRLVNVVRTDLGKIYYTAKDKKNPLPFGWTVTYVKKDYYELGKPL